MCQCKLTTTPYAVSEENEENTCAGPSWPGLGKRTLPTCSHGSLGRTWSPMQLVWVSNMKTKPACVLSISYRHKKSRRKRNLRPKCAVERMTPPLEASECRARVSEVRSCFQSLFTVYLFCCGGQLWCGRPAGRVRSDRHGRRGRGQSAGPPRIIRAIHCNLLATGAAARAVGGGNPV